jgi:hypothetical protein
MQRGYGTVVLQAHAHLATNRRLAVEARNATGLYCFYFVLFWLFVWGFDGYVCCV